MGRNFKKTKIAIVCLSLMFAGQTSFAGKNIYLTDENIDLSESLILGSENDPFSPWNTFKVDSFSIIMKPTEKEYVGYLFLAPGGSHVKPTIVSNNDIFFDLKDSKKSLIIDNIIYLGYTFTDIVVENNVFNIEGNATKIISPIKALEQHQLQMGNSYLINNSLYISNIDYYSDGFFDDDYFNNYNDLVTVSGQQHESESGMNLSRINQNKMIIRDSGIIGNISVAENYFNAYRYDTFGISEINDNLFRGSGDLNLYGDTTIHAGYFSGMSANNLDLKMQGNIIDFNLENTTVKSNAYLDMFATRAIIGRDSDEIEKGIGISLSNNKIYIKNEYQNVISGLRNIYGAHLKIIDGINSEVNAEEIFFQNGVSLTNNWVYYTGNKNGQTSNNQAVIYGAYIDGIDSISGAYDAFSGNTFYYRGGGQLTVKEMGGFENYIFDISRPNYQGALLTADTLYLQGTVRDANGNETIKQSNIRIAGINSGQTLVIGNTILLMQANKIVGADGVTISSLGDTPLSYRQQAAQGISFLYDMQIDVNTADNTVTATVLDPNNPNGNSNGNGQGSIGGSGAKVNPQLKSLSEGFLSGLMLTTRGADQLVSDVLDGYDNHVGYKAIASMKGGYTRYDSGSRVNAKDFTTIFGGSYTTPDNVTFGGFIEGGTSDYKSKNYFDTVADVRGDGDSNFYGLGLFGKYQSTTGFFIDGSARFGKSKTDFHTDGFLSGDGFPVKYKTKSNYFGAHVGAGYEWALNNETSLNVTGRYFYSQVRGKEVQIGNDPIAFDNAKSSRARVSVGVNTQFAQDSTFRAALGYEYEFDGKVNATTHSIYSIDAPEVKGSTGVLQVGMDYMATDNLILKFDIEGYAGKRRGGSANLGLKYYYGQDTK